MVLAVSLGCGASGPGRSNAVPSPTVSAPASSGRPVRGALLYESSFAARELRVLYQANASMTFRPKSSVDCTVDAQGGKIGAEAAVARGGAGAVWAEIDFAVSRPGGIALGWYVDGFGSSLGHHYHVDVVRQQVGLRDGSFRDVGVPAALPGLTAGQPQHLAAIVTPPRYRLLRDGVQVADFTDTSGSPGSGYGFDCAGIHPDGVGTIRISGLRIYTIRPGS